MFAAPSITLESDESVNGAATDRGRRRGGRTDDVSIQRSWFDSIVIDGVEQNLIRIPDRVRERQGGGKGGLRGGPFMCRHAAAPRM